MIQTARENPRQLAKFQKTIFELAKSPRFAEVASYVLPRGEKKITGPSIRFAEALVQEWGNCQWIAQEVGRSDTHVIVAGIFFDFEKNIVNGATVSRPIIYSQGKFKGQRYSEDMVSTTVAAAGAIAKRNAVLKGGIPQAHWEAAYTQAQLTLTHEANNPALRKQVGEKIEAYIGSMGYDPADVLRRLYGVAGWGYLSAEQFTELRQLANSVRAGETSPDEAFGRPEEPAQEAPRTRRNQKATSEPSDQAEALREAVRAKEEAAPKTEEPAPVKEKEAEAADTAEEVDLPARMSTIAKAREILVRVQKQIAAADDKPSWLNDFQEIAQEIATAKPSENRLWELIDWLESL
jgi:hypothetical protein